MTAARLAGGVAAQARSAFVATSIAVPISCFDTSDTSLLTSPVAGLMTSAVRPATPAQCLLDKK